MNDKPEAPRPDDSVPVGNYPPRSKSIVVIAAIAWVAWFIFLVAMMLDRINHSVR